MSRIAKLHEVVMRRSGSAFQRTGPPSNMVLFVK